MKRRSRHAFIVLGVITIACWLFVMSQLLSPQPFDPFKVILSSVFAISGLGLSIAGYRA